jgi:hypothetical protein
MQQSRLDHWLKRKFVHETQIYCNTLPQSLDARFMVVEAPAGQPASHRYRVTADNEDALLDLVERFRGEGITYAATIQEKSGRLSNWICRPGRSVTCEVIWMLLIAVGVGCLLYFLPLMKIVTTVREVLASR